MECLDVNAAAAERVAAELQARGGTGAAWTVDIADEAAVVSAFDRIVRGDGRLDAVVCTPAINVRKPILKYTGDEFDRVVKVNLRGNFNVLQAAGRIMTSQKSREHRAVLVDPVARHRAGAVGLLDEQGRHRAARENGGDGMGQWTACA